MRIGLAQLNPTVGDLAGNRRRILDAYRSLVAQGAELVVFPELIVCGYPPRDLLFKRRFVPDNEESLTEIAAAIGEVPAIIGFVETNPAPTGRRFFNAAAFCHRGEIQVIGRKCLLPTYDVFDEDRYFEAASEPRIVTFDGKRIGLTICEDLWKNPKIDTARLYEINPIAWLAAERVDLVVNLSASPWYAGKGAVRDQLVTDTAKQLRCPLVYVNAIGGNDELVFDGRSLVANENGEITARLAAFTEDLRTVEIPLSSSPTPPASEPSSVKSSALSVERSTNSPASTPAPTGHWSLVTGHSPPPAASNHSADIYAALVLGLRDYAHKSGFKRALIALSGGIDSALVAVLAVEALGAENVIGVSLPSSISSQHSKDDARILAENLGIRFETIAIADAVATAEAALGPIFAGRARDVTEENIQARIRGVIMMALSNKFGALLLTTGNKSEVAVGYCTLYGDMCGGLAVISDVFKTQVYALCRWINCEREIIPENTITKPPSAELRPGQVDQDSLPPYDILDAILEGYVEKGLSRRDLVREGFNETVINDIVRKVDLNEYKRKQMAPGIKITPLAFGVGRRIPIVQKYVS
ncbi:NAD+ synthase [Nibricoccus aquaticus]|uniref:Glutamine-dependent NAD(+) synthetase n=1 Tax=Nibricoccus aquaticus TaxID=2576891 RepID=A0A290QNB2_9BACT|nr:NAD+ synthase [Nibricoccus aquaticus]ATC66241.1 NAD+ synthase [Nibricoccus aquaticus]